MLVKDGCMNYVLVILKLILMVKNYCVHSVVFEYKCSVFLRFSWTILISIIPAENLNDNLQFEAC